MKIIDLLNLIVISEEQDLPKRIKYMGYTFEYDTNHKRYESYFDDQIWTLNDFVNINDNLTDEVEIIEENKIPEKLNEDFNQHCNEYLYKKVEDKVNEIIDYLKSKGE